MNEIAERITAKYLPQEGYGENLAETTVTAMNRIIYRWWNDGEGIVVGEDLIAPFDYVGMGRNTACFLFLYDHPELIGEQIQFPKCEHEYESTVKTLENILGSVDFEKLMQDAESKPNTAEVAEIEAGEDEFADTAERLMREDEDDDY